MPEIKFMKKFAQAVLVVMVTIIIACIMSAVSPSDENEFVPRMIGGIPLFDTWFEFLTDYQTFSLDNLPGIYLESFFEALIMGICMTVCGKVAKFLHVTRILPFGDIFVTFAGLVFGAFLCLEIDQESGVATIIAVGLISVYGLLLMIKSVLPGIPLLSNLLSLGDILIIIINSIVAVILTGYIVALFVYIDGGIRLSQLLGIGLLAVISLLILYTVDGFGTIIGNKKFN